MAQLGPLQSYYQGVGQGSVFIGRLNWGETHLELTQVVRIIPFLVAVKLRAIASSKETRKQNPRASWLPGRFPCNAATGVIA